MDEVKIVCILFRIFFDYPNVNLIVIINQLKETIIKSLNLLRNNIGIPI